MLRVCFNCYGNYTTDSVFQWDQNHILHIVGLDLTYAPAVHFCNKKSTEAIVVQSEKVDDGFTAPIPNILLQEPYNIIAYVHLYDVNEENAKTIEIVNIPLVKRVKPSEYQFEDNVPVMSFERLETDIADFIAKIEGEFLEYKTETDAKYNSFTSATNTKYNNFTNDTNTKYDDFTTETNRTVNDLKDSIETGINRSSGTIVSIDDSLEAPLVEFIEYGYINQNTLSGKNLLSSRGLVETTNNGITFTPVYEDGLLQYINVNGTATATVTFSITTMSPGNGNYLLSGCNNGNTETYLLTVRTVKNGTNTWYHNTTTDKPFTISDIETFGSCYIQVSSGVTVNNAKIYPMIRLASDTDSTYEPYCGGIASPNPDYPQEIQGLGNSGSIEVRTYGGKNLSDVESATGTILVEIPLNNLINNKTYTISFDISSTDTDSTQSTFSYNDKTLGNRYRSNRISFTFTKVEGADFIRAYASINYAKSVDDTVTVSNIQIELGETMTDYESYKGSTVATIPIDALLYEGDYIKRFADGTGQIVRKCEKVVFDGSEDWIKNGELTNAYYRTLLLAKGGANSVVYCTHFIYNSTFAEGCIRFSSLGNKIHVSPLASQNITTSAELKTWLQSNPITVVYELAEPIITPLTVEQLAEIEKLCTFEPVTNVLADGVVAVGYFKNNLNGEYLRDHTHDERYAFKKDFEQLVTIDATTRVIGTFGDKKLYRKLINGLTLASGEEYNLGSNTRIVNAYGTARYNNTYEVIGHTDDIKIYNASSGLVGGTESGRIRNNSDYTYTFSVVVEYIDTSW